MSKEHETIQLQLHPPRKYQSKRRLARNMRKKGYSEEHIKRVVWHPENSPNKGKSCVK